MNSPNSIIETPKMNPTKGLAYDITRPVFATGQIIETVASEGTVPVLEWAEAEAYAVAIQEKAPSGSTAFRLSF